MSETVKITQRHEILAWLGDDHGLTDAQITDLTRQADDIAARYPDDQDDRDAALTVAYRLMVEPTDAVVAELRATREAGRVAMIGLRQAAVQLVDPHAGKGARGLRSQAGYATASGVDRSVVREWIGL